MSQLSLEMTDDNMGEPPQNHQQQPRRVVDRQIPLAVLGALLLQIGAGIWYASAQAQTIKQTVDRLTSVEIHNAIVDNELGDIKTTLAVLKDRSNDSADTSHRIENYLKSGHHE